MCRKDLGQDINFVFEGTFHWRWKTSEEKEKQPPFKESLYRSKGCFHDTHKHTHTHTHTHNIQVIKSISLLSVVLIDLLLYPELSSRKKLEALFHTKIQESTKMWLCSFCSSSVPQEQTWPRRSNLKETQTFMKKQYCELLLCVAQVLVLQIVQCISKSWRR